MTSTISNNNNSLAGKLKLSLGLQLIFHRVQQTVLLQPLITNHNLQKHILQSAVTNCPFELRILTLLQLSQALQYYRHSVLTNIHLDEATYLFDNNCGSEHC